jgi:hypothetical protein
MNKILHTMMLMISLAFAAAVHAGTTNIRLLGSSCIEANDRMSFRLERSNLGVTWGMPDRGSSIGDAYATVICPFPVADLALTPNSITLYGVGYDRHPVINLKCYMDVVDDTGRVIASANGYTVNSGSAAKRFKASVTNLDTTPLLPKSVLVTCMIPQVYNPDYSITAIDAQRSFLTTLDLELKD